jgi:hypothetical protein
MRLLFPLNDDPRMMPRPVLGRRMLTGTPRNGVGESSLSTRCQHSATVESMEKLREGDYGRSNPCTGRVIIQVGYSSTAHKTDLAPDLRWQNQVQPHFLTQGDTAFSKGRTRIQLAAAALAIRRGCNTTANIHTTSSRIADISSQWQRDQYLRQRLQ